MIESRRIVRSLCGLLLLTALAALAGCAKTPAPLVEHIEPDSGWLGEGTSPGLRIQRVMTDHTIPGGSLAIAYGDRLDQRGFGVTRMGGDAVSAKTLFRVGSLTKSVTAAAIVELQRAGRVAMDAPVGRYLPNYRYGRDITIRQLLDQTSGIPNYLGDSRVRSALVTGRPIDPVSLVESYRPAFKPGSRWQYSNSNYLLLSSIIGRASGTTYNLYVRGSVLTACEPEPENVAHGYTLMHNRLLAQPVLPSALLGGAAGMSSDAGDLAKWANCFAGTILPRTGAGATHAAQQRYVLGWLRTSIDGTTVFWHNGLEPGFAAAMTMVPSRRLAVAVAFNSDAYDPTELALTITADLLRTSRTALHPRKAL
jgi:CubicO group peptidase (beta-lactamase class C family)